jgi:hypothetical protein
MPFRAPLGWIEWTLYLTGTSGGGKTESGAIPIRHFAPGLPARNAPASWHDTYTDLEQKLSVTPIQRRIGPC